LEFDVSTFLAIDFETANYDRDSACAIGIALGRDGRIVREESFLIRPPSAWFTFTHIHHLTWEQVRESRNFAELWPLLREYFEAADFLAAHNASFDRGVLSACCETYDLAVPRIPFVCTVRLARAQWGIRPTKLPDVCRVLDIPLNHHDAASDSSACARIVLAAMAQGWRYGGAE